METLLIRLKNLETQIKKFDTDFILNTKQLRIYITRAEVIRLLEISEDTLDLLVKSSFLNISKKGECGVTDFLLEDVIWLKNQRVDLMNHSVILELKKHKKKLRK
ncbi:hypothetical protein [Rhizosphaericola mali]|uniref:Uncharacterized protein n=1 Tax=Rhizosphaericola mali TaxID=2545455 RepID=A0A5P2GDZ3_9BACT|nr:hypothetical protein [Rhizosphaericola mali]QES89831.1 hypothetical protein E0W69_014565 [Rhizosphaericola mali]